MENKKYELTDNKIKISTGQTLYQIKALKDFNDVKAGDLGGFVEKEESLSQDYYCWVYEDACIYGNARICFNAQIYGHAQVYDDACVYGDISIFGDSRLCGNTYIE